MKYELKGKLIVLNETQQVSEKFKKREFVVEQSYTTQNGFEFNEQIKFQAVQDKVSILDSVQVGQDVTVHFNIKGSKWEKDGREMYFVNLDAWKVEGEAVEQSEPVKEQSAPATGEDGLPF